MTKSEPLTTAARGALLRASLEAVRLETLRRLEEKGLPTSVTVDRPTIVPQPPGRPPMSDRVDSQVAPRGLGLQLASEPVTVSSLHRADIARTIEDGGGKYFYHSFHEQLLSLAEHLDEATDLGAPENYKPESGPGAIVDRYLSGLARFYLLSLRDVRQGEGELLDRLATELEMLCDRSTVYIVKQLVLTGLEPSEALLPSRQNVYLRRLSPRERGDAYEAFAPHEPEIRHPDLFLPRTDYGFRPPTAILEIREQRTRKPYISKQLFTRLALAFYLLGFRMQTMGVTTSHTEPKWGRSAAGTGRFIVDNSSYDIMAKDTISQAEFDEIVDLAHRMEPFENEQTGRHIALSRVLRGCATPDTGLLDFTIALEAALLGGTNSELSYRFSLYGAVFLREERDAAETYKQMKNIYEIRSKLVHGSKTDTDVRGKAQRDAAELAKAVIKKAILDGWPDRRHLDELALTGG
jgi:hypothetical protein